MPQQDHPLARWLSRRSMTVRAFAGAIEVKSVNTVYRYLRYEQIPQPDVMARIVRATGGEIRPNDFYRNDALAPVDNNTQDGAAAGEGKPQSLGHPQDREVRRCGHSTEESIPPPPFDVPDGAAP